MKKYSKYLYTLGLFLITYFFAEGIILTLSVSPNGIHSELSYIMIGIKLILAAIAGSTFLIMYTIKEYSKK